MITNDNTGVVYVGDGAPAVVNNQLAPIPPLTGVVSVSALGGPLLWPAPGISFVPDVIITGGS